MNWFWEKVFKVAAGLTVEQKLKSLGADTKGAKITVMELPSGSPEPQPPTGIKESRDLAHCHPELRKRYLALKADFEKETGCQLFETCTWRSKERQQELYAQGRTAPGKIVTKVDGVNSKSRHQVFPSQAVDVAVDTDPGPGKHVVWNPEAYAPLGALCLKHGLVWGGDWNGNGRSDDERFIDFPHMELSAKVAWEATSTT